MIQKREEFKSLLKDFCQNTAPFVDLHPKDGDPLFVNEDNRTYTRRNPKTGEVETIQSGGRMNAHALSMILHDVQKRMKMVEEDHQAPFRPKRFRKLFRTACATEGLDEGYRLLFMGHVGNVSSGYLEKPRAMLEAEYVKLEPYVTIFKTTTSEDMDRTNEELRETKQNLMKAKESVDEQKIRMIGRLRGLRGLGK